MASRRQYLTQEELAKFADITIVDATEADDQISQAEEIIDADIGPQDQFFDSDFSNIVEGKFSAVGPSGGSLSGYLESRHANNFLTNFFTYCEVEIIGGTGQGQRAIISASSYPNTFITFRDALTTPIDNTSFYRIYQLGKFPRKRDVYLDAINPPSPIYYKNIPENIKRATAAQVEYMIQQGAMFFKTDDIFKTAENIGDYGYQKARDGSASNIEAMIAPKAKFFLRGYLNRKGRFII